MTSERGSLMKELHKLLQNADKLYDGQVEFVLDDGEKEKVAEEEEEEEEEEDENVDISFYVTAKEGPYKNARIKFKMFVPAWQYPDEAPKITCMNRVYHPNINSFMQADGADICVSLLDDEWEPEVGLDGAVMAVLFLFYNPQLDDFLNDAFHDTVDNDEYEANVKRSLRGEDVGEFEFDKLLDDTEENRDGEDNGSKHVAENTDPKNEDGAGAAASAEILEKAEKEDTAPEDVLVNVDLAHQNIPRRSAFKVCYSKLKDAFSSIRASFKKRS